MHLFVDISAHGLGHLAQTAPVIAALRARQPGLQLSVASGLARTQLARRIAEPFTHIAQASDFGFAMHNAIDINFATSRARYQNFHADWPERVTRYAQYLKDAGADQVLANAAYLPLAAAAQAGIPCAGLCSLNWADLFAHYFAGNEGDDAIHQQILAAYNAADVFLRIAPGMPMADFANAHDIGPIAALVQRPKPSLRAELATALNLSLDQRWVLVAMGGMEFRLPVEQWPVNAKTVWLCPDNWQVQRPDVRAFDAASVTLPFTELLGACDAVLTKPGYGTFLEAACNGVPILYVPRDNWPEEAPMVHWLQSRARIFAVSRACAFSGDLMPALSALWQQPAVPPPRPTGADEAAHWMIERLPLAKSRRW